MKTRIKDLFFARIWIEIHWIFFIVVEIITKYYVKNYLYVIINYYLLSKHLILATR